MPTWNALTTCVLATCLFLFSEAGHAADLAADGASTPSAASTTATYANARYGYTIAYPETLLTPGAEADDGDGRVFTAKTGTAQVAVWGRFNAGDDSPAAMLHEEEDGTCTGTPPSYEVSRKDLVAFSCETSEKDIVYEKMIIRDDTIAAVEFTYPASEQASWAPIIEEMAGSLRIAERPQAE
ncbi:hypothetical protein [Robbsia sp. KACC 23696]|uniref:hypothetical protein n=1 Tax=Robbsia sp. KACC 23696 TaxID=3149231 RepID=UPI00325C3389